MPSDPPRHPSSALLAILVTAVGLAGPGCAARQPPVDAPAATPPVDAGAPSGQPTLLDMTAPAALARAGVRDAEEAARRDAAAPSQAGRLLIYSAITGHQPVGQQSPQAPASGRYGSPAEAETARAARIEAEIAEELARQEQIAVEEHGAAVASPVALPDPADAADANPLLAPRAPVERQLPDSLYRIERVTIAPGAWGNATPLEVVRKTLDADGDGRPEEILYREPEGAELMLRSERDRDLDGRIDTWSTYREGVLAVRVLDGNGDGAADAWERYAEGRLEFRSVDRDGDGVRDTFYRYAGEDLAEKLHDSNDDGTIDRIVTYAEGRRVRSEEDRSLNGWMDTWTSYGVVEGREVVARIERDTRDQGRPNVFETYATRGGETRLALREEDLNGDGNIDVVSRYEDGKLVQRAISDEALTPL